MTPMTFLRLAYQRGLVTVSLFAALLLVATCVVIQPARAHPWAITECHDNIEYAEAVKVGEWVDEGRVFYWAEAYDTNGDGVKDVVALSHFITLERGMSGRIYQEHDPHPVYWLVDRDYDDIPDEAYIDINGKGNCHDIKLYKNLNNPATLTPDFDNKGDATI